MWSYRRSSCSGSSRWSPSPRLDRRLRGSNDDATAIRVAARHAASRCSAWTRRRRRRRGAPALRAHAAQGHRAGGRVGPVSAHVARRAGSYSSPCSAAFAYWRLRPFQPQASKPVSEPPFGGGPIVPTTPDQEPSLVYEPSISWIPIAVVVGLVLAAVIAYFVAERRARRERTPRVRQLAEELAAVLDETLDDLRAEADPRRAIIAAYARMERVLAANGIARRPAETSDEYLARVLGDLALGSDAIARLTSLFTQAKFSQHEVDSSDEGGGDRRSRAGAGRAAAGTTRFGCEPDRSTLGRSRDRRETRAPRRASTPRRPDARARRGRRSSSRDARASQLASTRSSLCATARRARPPRAATSVPARRRPLRDARRAAPASTSPTGKPRADRARGGAWSRRIVRAPLPLRPAPALDRRRPARRHAGGSRSRRNPTLRMPSSATPTWELVRPDRPAPEDRLSRGISPHELEQVVAALEAV